MCRPHWGGRFVWESQMDLLRSVQARDRLQASKYVAEH